MRLFSYLKKALKRNQSSPFREYRARFDKFDINLLCIRYFPDVLIWISDRSTGGYIVRIKDLLIIPGSWLRGDGHNNCSLLRSCSTPKNISVLLKEYIIYFQDTTQFYFNTEMASYLDSGRSLYIHYRPYEVGPLVDSLAWNAVSNMLLQKKLFTTGSWHGHVTLETCLK